MKAWRIIRNVLLSLVGLVLVLLVTLQVFLRPAVLTRIVNGLAADYVEGEVSFQKVRAHVIKSFPYLNVEADDFSITYPRSRFDSLATGVDTLVSVRKLVLSINYMDLKEGKYNIHQAEFRHPRIFARRFGAESANWDILPLGKGGEVQEEGEGKPLPPIELRKVLLTERPLLVYTDPADTLSLRLDHLEAAMRDWHFELDAQADARVQNLAYGNLQLPLGIRARGDVLRREEELCGARFQQLELQLSALKLLAEGHVQMLPEGWDLLVDASTEKAPLGALMDAYKENFPVLKKWNTDAVLDLKAHAEGTYGNGKTPSVTASVQIPDAFLDYEGLGHSGRVSLDAVVETDESRRVNADVRRLVLGIIGARISASGTVGDILGEDPQLALDADILARVDSLTNAFTRERGISGTGSLQAGLHGKARLSQLNLADIGQTHIGCNLVARNLSVEDLPDSLRAYFRRVDAQLETRSDILSLQAGMDTLDVTYKDNVYVRGTALKLLMQNSVDLLRGQTERSSLTGRLHLATLDLRDGEGLTVALQDNVESFRIIPASESSPVPRLSLGSGSGLIHVNSGPDTYILDSLRFRLSASRHQARERGNLARPPRRDSLRRARPQAPQDDFSRADITISLSQALAKYVREWDYNGDVNLKDGMIVLPAFPLLTRVSSLQGSLDNDSVDLSNITVQAGVSDLNARGKLTGLRRALLSRGRRAPLKLDATVDWDYIDANELMRAYAYYTTYQPEGEQTAVSYEALDTIQSPSRLLVLPSNLDLTLSLEGTGVKYDSLLVSWVAADVAMRNRTLQITNTVASSNMGDIYFEGFYATRSKEDIKAGFDLNLVDITAEKVITLFPAVDTLMPMLTSFAGDLDCELAATSELDTCMNLVLPSVDGIMKISGKDLSLRESEEFTKIAQKLMFRNRAEARIDNMAVTGMVRDNQLEIFPFVLDVDRYLFAASGIQNLDRGFDYHISVIRSPFLLKFGVNAWGEDFSDVHYTLSKARYKSVNVPVFTKQLDTVQYSLVAAIHNVFELGVEKALAENNSRRFLQSLSDEVPELVPVQVPPDSLERMAALYEDVMLRVSSRREALKQEVLDLEEQVAIKNKEDDEQ